MEPACDKIALESVPLHVEGPPEPTAKEIKQALIDVLQSPSFRTSKQSQRLLQYVVDQTLAGRDEMLKERVIGAAVFGKNVAYDTGDDPIVRVRAADTRKRLAQYYAGVGIVSAIRIEIHPGSYRPSFTTGANSFAKGHAREAGSTAHLSLEALGQSIGSATPSSRISSTVRRSWIQKRSWLIALCILGTFVTGLLRLTQKTAFDLFWAPFPDHSKPVLIYLGTDAVYRLSRDYLNKYRKTHDTVSEGQELYVPLGAGEKIDVTDLVQMSGVFLEGNDVAATSDIVSLIAHRGKTYDLRWGQDISIGDLRHGPVILIGGFNNIWTLETTNQLRFIFKHNTEIRDTLNAQRKWSILFDSTGNVTDDYAIVSRLINTKIGASIITVSGIGQGGTEAAGDFVTNPQQIAQAVSRSATGWNKRNMQILLHAKIVDGVPVSVNIVDVYSW